MLPVAGECSPPAWPTGRFQLPSRRCKFARQSATASVIGLGATPAFGREPGGCTACPARIGPPARFPSRYVSRALFKNARVTSVGCAARARSTGTPRSVASFTAMAGQALVMTRNALRPVGKAGARGQQLCSAPFQWRHARRAASRLLGGAGAGGAQRFRSGLPEQAVRRASRPASAPSRGGRPPDIVSRRRPAPFSSSISMTAGFARADAAAIISGVQPRDPLASLIRTT